jgi:diketogulonate reductase-like aldo/keto reductase
VAVVNPNADRAGPMVDARVGSITKRGIIDNLKRKQIAQIASETETSPAQVLLSWAVQRGTSAVPKTSHEARLVANRMLIRLSEYQMSVVDNLASMRGEVRFLDPKGYIGFDIFDEVRDQPVSTEQLYT